MLEPIVINTSGESEGESGDGRGVSTAESSAGSVQFAAVAAAGWYPSCWLRLEECLRLCEGVVHRKPDK